MQKYSCKNCGAELFWDANLGLLKCQYCDEEFHVEDFEDSTIDENAEKTVGSKTNMFGEELEEGYVAYKCSYCGAEVVTTETTVATVCAYCGRALSITSNLSGSFRPEKVIPFAVTKEVAIEKYNSFVKSCFLAPKVFKQRDNIKKIQGLYVPFYLHSMDVESDINMECTDIKHRKSGYDRINTHNVYSVDVDLVGKFDNVPTDASKKIDNTLMDAVEPFNYKDIVDFNPAFMAGYFAEQNDENDKETIVRAESRIKEFLQESAKNEVSGYELKVVKGNNTKIENQNSQYVMLPIWLLSIEWKEKIYMIAINGQTGKVAGVLPKSNLKLFLITAGIFYIPQVLVSAFNVIMTLIGG